MPRSSKPAVNANVVYFIGLIAFIALIGVLYLYTNSAVVGRAFTIDTGSLITTPEPSAGVTGGENCVYPTNGKNYDSSYNGQQVNLCFGTYNFPNGIMVTGTGITINCGDGLVKFVGNGQSNSIGVTVSNSENSIFGCDISNYNEGIILTGNSHNFHSINVHNNLGAGVNSGPSSNNYFTSVKLVNNGFQGIIGDFSYTRITDSNISSNGHTGIAIQRGTGHNAIERNYIIDNQNDGSSIYDSSDNSFIANTINSNKMNGIYAYISENNEFIANTISGNSGFGIHFKWDVNENTLNSNIISDNSNGGIVLEDSDYNTLTSNTIRNNQGYGAYLDPESDLNTLSSNTINNNFANNVHIYAGENNTITSNTITYSQFGSGIHCEGCDYSIISSNIINNNKREGIHVHGSWQSTIASNVISGNDYGLMLDGVYHNTIENNTIEGSSFSGIRMSSVGTYPSYVIRNTIRNNLGAGIELQAGSYNLFSTNTITGNLGTGILINGSTNNDLIGNIISSNSQNGLSMLNGSSGTDLSTNTICTNTQYDIFCGNSGPTTFDG
ncbi:MAG: right-handed parallel beta-helix repeat-containing protein, partial [Candidatus Micrarchaeota archaeon]